MPDEREALLARLEAMPAFLETSLGGLSAEQACVRRVSDIFAPVEQCWHLADLEVEGYAARIQRLLQESDPQLPDFDGARVAEERRYPSLCLADGLRRFRAARAANVARLRAIADADWERSGRQDGVGRVRIADVPVMMAEHDASHRAEIEGWLA